MSTTAKYYTELADLVEGIVFGQPVVYDMRTQSTWPLYDNAADNIKVYQNILIDRQAKGVA